MADIVSLYTALAGAASVFIGLMSALIVNQLISQHNQREELWQRIQYIDSNLGSYSKERKKYSKSLHSLEKQWKLEDMSNKAEKEVEEYLSDADLEENSPQELLFGLIDELGGIPAAHQQLFWDEISPEDNPAAEPYKKAVSNPQSLPEAMMIQEKDIFKYRLYNLRYKEWLRANRQIDSMNNERQTLKSKFESLEPSHHTKEMYILIGSVTLSVFVPLLTHLLIVTNKEISVGSLSDAEPIIVFSSWTVGLALVIYYLYRMVRDDIDSIDENPDIESREYQPEYLPDPLDEEMNTLQDNDF